MPTKDERLQAVWHRYEAERQHKPSGTREAVEWAVAEGLLELPTADPYDMLASQMANALRQEIQRDHQGRRFRVNHAVRVSKGGVQYTFWAMMKYAPHAHMERAFGQRRGQIVDDCVQLKTDVDAYNDMNRGKRPLIQLVLDFTEDVAEHQVAASAA